MTMPTLTVTGQELYDAIAPLMQSPTPGYSDAENGYAGAILCAAYATMVDPVSDIVRDQDDGTPGYAILFDPQGLVDRRMEQWLPWVAQFVGDGQAVSAAPDTATKLAIIQQPMQFKRGRPATLIAAAQTTLTGAKTVILNQFYGSDPNHILLATYTSQTPDPVTTESAIRAVLPAWIVLTYSVVTGGDYSTLAASHSTYTAMEAAHTTYADIPTNPAA